jgi:hypothetical protein
MSIRRNRPWLTHFAGLVLLGHLAMPAFGALLTPVTFFAVGPVQGREDLTMPATRPGASAVIAKRASAGQLGSATRGQPGVRSKGGAASLQLLAGPTHSASFGVGVETGSAGKMAGSRSSASKALSVTLPPSNTTGFSASLDTDRPTPFAAKTGLIAAAGARYYDVNPFTWVLVVLLVLIVAFICGPPPPGDLDTGPGCNGA